MEAVVALGWVVFEAVLSLVARREERRINGEGT